MRVREFGFRDKDAWVRMRALLWPDVGSDDEQIADAEAWLRRKDAVVLMAEESGRLVGFAEAGERAYADGCDSSPVGFLEGWFVETDWRGRGVGRELVEGVKAWCRGQGYQELASDALLEDGEAHAAHEGVGFAEVERAVRYRMAV